LKGWLGFQETIRKNENKKRVDGFFSSSHRDKKRDRRENIYEGISIEMIE
jgi:hypothetical protein